MIRTRHAIFLAVALIGSTSAFAWAVTGMPGFSTFFAGGMKATLAFGALAAFVYFGLDIDTKEEMKQIRGDPVAVAILILAVAVILAPAVASGQPAADTACTEIGVTENPPGSNAGPAVESYLASVGLSGGYPWCAAFARKMMDQAGTSAPAVRSAGATDYITRRSIKATQVLRGARDVPDGALVIWRRGSTWKGHIGFVQHWDRRCGRTVEGNTSPGRDGRQRDGDGVWARERCINPGSYFRIVAFTPTG